MSRGATLGLGIFFHVLECFCLRRAEGRVGCGVPFFLKLFFVFCFLFFVCCFLFVVVVVGVFFPFFFSDVVVRFQVVVDYKIELEFCLVALLWMVSYTTDLSWEVLCILGSVLRS